MSVCRMLVISTAHLPDRYQWDGPGVDHGVAADAVTYGWLMYVPEDPAEHVEGGAGEVLVTPEVLAIQQHARSQGCDYVKFDCDGVTVESLPTWEW